MSQNKIYLKYIVHTCLICEFIMNLNRRFKTPSSLSIIIWFGNYSNIFIMVSSFGDDWFFFLLNFIKISLILLTLESRSIMFFFSKFIFLKNALKLLTKITKQKLLFFCFDKTWLNFLIIKEKVIFINLILKIKYLKMTKNLKNLKVNIS